MTYRIDAALETRQRLFGIEVKSSESLVGTGPSSALATGTIGIPAGTPSGTSFDIAMGDVVPYLLLLKNGGQPLDVRLNGADTALTVGADGLLLIQQQSDGIEPMASISVRTVAEQIDPGSVAFVVSGEYSESQLGDPIYLWVPDNSNREPGVTEAQNYFTVYGLTRQQVFGGNYDGVPHLKLRIRLASVAHGAEACSDGTLLVMASEAAGETAPPGEFNANYHESVLVIDPQKIRSPLTPEVRDITASDFVRVRCGELGGPPSGPFPAVTHVGLRDATQLHDGSILLSRGPIFTRMSLDRLRTKNDLVNAPVQTSNTPGARPGYKITADPLNPEHVWQLGREANLPSALWQFDLTNPPGASAVDRMGVGQTGGSYVASADQYDPNNWGAAGVAFDSMSRLWIARGGVPDLACWTREQLNQFNGGSPPVNLTPTLTVTSSVFNALNLANESIYALEIIDDHFFVATYYHGALPRPPARMWIFGPEILNGGAHDPILEINGLPSAASQLVFAPGV